MALRKMWPEKISLSTIGYPLERLWKPVALGRKNYLFVGNDDGGERAAIAYTITLTCKIHGIDPYQYLTNIIPALHRGVDPQTLTPYQWSLRQQATLINEHVAYKIKLTLHFTRRLKLSNRLR